MDKKIIAELEDLYSGVEGWTNEERERNIRFAYNSVMAQREAQAGHGAVDANDPEAVRAAVIARKAAAGGSAEKRAVYAVDSSTNAAVAGVEAAKAEADEAYQAQRDAVAAEEANDLDNSALYSQLRGDRGGIGKAQYDSIQNTAAKNQAEINRAQTAMARSAAVEIASLQAQGEYEKAERLLELAQERLAALAEMSRLQAEYEVDERDFREQLRRWQAEYDLSAAKLTGHTASGAPTADTLVRLAALGEAMLKKGLMPNAAQLSAMGMTAAQAWEYIGRAE